MNSADSPQRNVLGLDARALLAQVCNRPLIQTSALLRAWTPPEPAELTPLFRQLEVESLLGRGGMGAVYKARQTDLDRDVAIKLLPPEAALDEAFAERFRAEARALARMEHPNIVTVHEAGQTSRGHLYFIMEYVEGRDLAHAVSDGPLRPHEALSIASSVCAALEYSHSQGIVHRDIKPANVLLRNDGAVKVVDFGLSCLAAQSGDDTSRLTEAGSGLGTPVYMAPEQRAGKPVDGRADIYSLGVMIYELLTGELPQGTWLVPSQKGLCSRQFDSVIARALEQDPGLRTTTITELHREIRRELSKGMAMPGRRRFLWVSGAAAVLASGGWAWWRYRGLKPGIVPASVAHELLVNLDLSQAAVSGEWQWMEGDRGNTLTVSYTPDKTADKMLCLPAALTGHSDYELTGELQLDSVGADLAVIFPAGQTRGALVLDLKGYSGIESIGQADWRSNPTTVQRRLPVGRYLSFSLKVRAASRIGLTVDLDGSGFIQWEGSPDQLSLPVHEYPAADLRSGEPSLAVFSRKGGIRMRGWNLKIGT